MTNKEIADLNAEGMVICPAGDPTKGPLLINLKAVNAVMARLDEAAFVTTQKAPELLTAYNKAWKELCEHVAVLEYEQRKAENAAARVKAKVMLDKVPEILRERKMESSKSPMGSEDVRRAIVALDPEYADAVDRCSQIECIVKLLSIKADALRGAYFSVKDMCYGSRRGGTDPVRELGGWEEQAGGPLPGMGKPRY